MDEECARRSETFVCVPFPRSMYPNRGDDWKSKATRYNRDIKSIEVPFLTERRNGWINEASLRRNRWWREAWRGIDRRCDFPSLFTPDQRHPPFRTLSLSRPPALTAALSLSLHRSLGRPTFTLRLCLSAVVLALLLSPASRRRHSPSSPPNESTRVRISAPLFPSFLLVPPPVISLSFNCAYIFSFSCTFAFL